MSDTSEDTIQSDRQSDKEDGCCRDFIRGHCDRKLCKYKHENEIKALNFCHDYQNNICTRLNCKFIHCSPEEVEEYKRTGQMSNQILAEATRKNQIQGNIPICNQFKKGMCRRTFCKYRHLTKDQEEAEILELIQNNGQRKNAIILSNNNIINESQLVNLGSLNNVLRRNGISYDEYADDGLPLIKRRFLTQEQEIVTCDVIDPNRTRPIFRGYFAGNPPSPMLSRVDARTFMLEEENSILHKEIAQLKKQVSDLTATNEFLLDQNATLRVNGKRNGAVSTAVAITAANASPQPRQVIASVATVPVSLATVSTCNPVVSIGGAVPTVSIAPPQAQLLTANNQILVTANASPQLAIANSSQAQLAIAQQNLANNLAQQAQPQLTSQAQQLALATTTQQLTSQAQHMANQQIALANTPQHQAQQLAAASQQLTSQAQQLALAGTNQQLTLANTNQQLTSQAQQLALAGTNQQLTSQAQQLTIANTPQQFSVANTPQQLTVANVQQQITLTGTNQQLLAAPNQQIEIHRNNQITGISTSQAIAMSNASQPMVSFPIMTQQSMNHALTH